MNTKLQQTFGHLFEKDLIESILTHGTLVTLKKGDLLINAGQTITTIPLVLNGIIKISREDENADEIVLYFLEKGDTCAVSLNCLNSKESIVKGIADVDTDIITIPVEKASQWICKYNSWKEFVLNSNNNRLEEMIEVIDTLAFMNMDERIHKYLTDQAKITNSSAINITHSKIAQDLNTSRVVVSRLLKQLEKQKRIVLYRSKIQLINKNS